MISKIVFKNLLLIVLAFVSMTSCSGNKTDGENQPVNDIVQPNQYKKAASRKMVKAIQNNHLALIEKLLEAGEDPNGTTTGYFRGGRKNGKNDRSNEDWTLLMYASYLNKIEAVKLLLLKKADINAVNAAGHSALFLACANRDEEIAAFLIENHADVKQAGSDRDGMTALQWVLAYEWNELALKMIRLGADLNTSCSETGKTVLLEALDGDSIHAEVIHLLIDSGADVNKVNLKYKSSPLMLACRRNDLTIARKILTKQVNINGIDDRRSTALCYAAGHSEDDTELLELLIKNGAKVHISNSYGRSALIEAVSSRSIKKVDFLLKNGAEVNRKSEGFGGVSPISEAVYNEDLEMVHLLIKNGADLSLETDNGETLLLRAILSKKSYPVVKLLIEKGADVNRSNIYKETPLMKAAQSNLPAIVKLLLDSGANKAGKNDYGKSAMDYAEETAARTGEYEVLELLKD
jgi:uncharacterized protein